METKLTLKLDKDIINQAKIYAKTNNLSLSKMVEKYFKSISDEYKSNNKNTKLVKELSGIIKLNDNENHKEKYIDHLIKKYK
jgi:uncharacterized protein DUF6364